MSPEGVIDVTPEETSEKLAQIRVIDVRRPDEYTGELGHIRGSTLVTLETDLKTRLEKLPKDDTYVFVCKSGGRSTTAAALARAKGFSSVYNMLGGMMNWNRLGLPTEK